MKWKIKSLIFFTVVALIGTIMSVTGCVTDEPEPVEIEQVSPPTVTIVNGNNMNFKVSNLTVDNGRLSAESGSSSTLNYKVTVNGKIISGTKKGDELPVRVGDILKIEYTPSDYNSVYNEINFTLPDSTTYKMPQDSSSFVWTVPSSFKSGMEIKGEATEKNQTYKLSGSVTLITLE